MQAVSSWRQTLAASAASRAAVCAPALPASQWQSARRSGWMPASQSPHAPLRPSPPSRLLQVTKAPAGTCTLPSSLLKRRSCPPPHAMPNLSWACEDIARYRLGCGLGASHGMWQAVAPVPSPGLCRTHGRDRGPCGCGRQPAGRAGGCRCRAPGRTAHSAGPAGTWAAGPADLRCALRPLQAASLHGTACSALDDLRSDQLLCFPSWG